MKRVVVTSLYFTLLFVLCTAPKLHASSSPIQLICPDDVHVGCGADLSDLDQFGQAFVHGYGDPFPAPSPSVHFHLNSCGVGFIKRTWVFYGSCGYVIACSQFIFVSGGGFGLSNITWPGDFETSECDASLLPKDLPSGFDKPTFDAVVCGEPVAGYKDWVFDKGSSGCVKVLRKWTVIDWCVYDPNAYYPKGIWHHTQVLKVKIMEAPELNCPDQISISTSPFTCDGANIIDLVADGTGFCGGDLNISNNSLYSSNGADASGFYPVGETVVTFTGDDGCGNIAKCQTLVIVKDEIAPSPVCIHGLSSTLGHHSDGYYLDLKAEWFNRNSFDNCTAKEDLKFEVYPERVDCDDIGEVEVILTVIDEAGNSDYCVTYIRITDNYDVCPAIDSLIVGGSVRTVDGITIDNGFVILSDDQGDPLETTSINNGLYQFLNVPGSSGYQLEPLCDTSPLSGVSTFDVLLLQMYIMGLWEPENPLQLISADVDFSGRIDVLDVAHIRNLILGRSDGFPSGQSLRFVDAEYQFVNRELPIEDNIPNKIVIDHLEKTDLSFDFVAFKLGDINSSFGFDNSTSETRSDLDLTHFPVIHSKEGDVHILSIEMPYSGPLFGLQFGFELPDYINLLKVNSAVFQGSDFDYSVLSNGQIRLSASSPFGVALEEGDVIFEMVVDNFVSHLGAIKGLSNEFYMDINNPNPMSLFIEADSRSYDLSNERMAVIFPNPVNGDYVNVQLTSTERSEGIQYSIYGANGQMLFAGQFDSSGSGSEILELDIKDLSSGIYILNISSNGSTQNLRFVVSK